jgi:hypothetical protein
MIRPENRFALFRDHAARTIAARVAGGQRLLKPSGQACIDMAPARR